MANDISKIKLPGSTTEYTLKDGSAVANITRSGTTFTATKRDGTTFTFTQQDNNTTYTLSADTTNNKIKLTPSSGGTQSITVPYASSAGSVSVPTANPETDTYYMPIFGYGFDDTPILYKHSNDYTYYLRKGTTSRIGESALILGNDVSSGTDDNSRGELVLYSEGSVSSILMMTNTNIGSAYKHYLPAVAGTIGVFTVTPTSGQVVVTDGTAGGFKTTGYTIAKSVPSDAVFTDHYAWTDITGKPSSFTPASHTHGNIQNGGTLQTNDITIASGDKLVVTDNSDSSKVARTSISFDGSTTTKCLTQKGTWATFGTSNLTLGTTASTALKGDTKYAGASTAGGSATSAAKLDTSTAGSATKPCYFANGVPSACTYSLNKTVPSDAVFTDTNTHRPIQVNGTEILGNNTTALNLEAGSNVSVTNSSGTVTIAATDTNTTYTLSADTTNNKITLTPSSGSAQSITVPYATSAGGVAWGNVTGKPSTFTPASHTHGIADITWAGNANLSATASANNQEWSIDLNSGSYTGTYWQIWSGKNSKTILACYTDTNDVKVPNGSFYVTNGEVIVGSGIELGTASASSPSFIDFHWNTTMSGNDFTARIWQRGENTVDLIGKNSSTWGIWRAGSFSTQSSIHAKENIQDITVEDSKKLLQLRPVTFNYKNGGLTDQAGLIAEEVYLVMPKMVIGDINYNPEEPWNTPSIDYSKFVPYLIKMVQEQQKEINELRRLVQG